MFNKALSMVADLCHSSIGPATMLSKQVKMMGKRGENTLISRGAGRKVEIELLYVGAAKRNIYCYMTLISFLLFATPPNYSKIPRLFAPLPR
jgi:hypothetical protein